MLMLEALASYKVVTVGELEFIISVKFKRKMLYSLLLFPVLVSTYCQ